MKDLLVGIVGLGPWGLCVLERLLTSYAGLESSGRRLKIHCFEPREPGAGVHATSEPEYLLLNTVCGQVSLFAGAERDGVLEQYQGKSFLDWIRSEGYTRGPDGPIRSSNGRPIAATDFVPRALFGRYANWCYQRLVESLPEGVSVEHHRESVTRIQPLEGDLTRLTTEKGLSVAVHHTFITTGHTPSMVDERVVAPYPAANLQGRVNDRATVAIAGMGLVAVDALVALTTGRGGRFRRENERLIYESSGREPYIRLFSRSGLCFQCRPASTLDSTGEYTPGVFTEEAIDRLRARRMREEGTPRLDFDRLVAPLLWAELRVHYQAEQVRLTRGVAAANDLRGSLIAAWNEERFEEAMTGLPPFDPEFECFRPDFDQCLDGQHYQAAVRATLQADVDDSRNGEENAPRKAAFELFRVLRNVLRRAVENDGLTPNSQLAFRRKVAGVVSRVTVGPPLQRGEELLALMDAGIVTIPFGRRPTCRLLDGSRWRISSTRLDQPHTEDVDALISGHLAPPDVRRTTSPLLVSLRDTALVVPFDREVECGIAIDESQHPIGADGRANMSLWVLGPLTEGARYFTNYLPSPKSRFKAFEEAEFCVRAIFTRAGWIAAR